MEERITRPWTELRACGADPAVAAPHSQLKHTWGGADGHSIDKESQETITVLQKKSVTTAPKDLWEVSVKREMREFFREGTVTSQGRGLECAERGKNLWGTQLKTMQIGRGKKCWERRKGVKKLKREKIELLPQRRPGCPLFLFACVCRVCAILSGFWLPFSVTCEQKTHSWADWK